MWAHLLSFKGCVALKAILILRPTPCRTTSSEQPALFEKLSQMLDALGDSIKHSQVSECGCMPGA
jgi:hypothetical protein